jgi:hypothetical protein
MISTAKPVEKKDGSGGKQVERGMECSGSAIGGRGGIDRRRGRNEDEQG